MKTLRIYATTRDREIAIQRMNDRMEYHKGVDSNIHGGASPVLYHSLLRPKVIVFPDWWTDADLRNYADRMSVIVLELEDEQHDSIIAQLDRRSVIDTTTPR
jgi:hypothetical protein